jgi:hypothetical protein
MLLFLSSILLTNKQTNMKTKLTTEEKNAIKQERKRQQQIETSKNQKPVKQITFNIEWKKSRMYGHNPVVNAQIIHEDNSYTNLYSKAGGWGYDKESTVIADIFNQCLAYKLYKLENIPSDIYGISEHDGRRYYAGGIGTNCYYKISEFLGGKFEKVGWGNCYDVYTLKF